MTVIKRSQAESTVRSAIVLDLGDLRREAERIQAEAERQARAMIEAGRRKAAQLTAGAEERGYEEGQRRGYEAGHEAGLEKGRQEALAEARSQFAELARQWSEALDRFEHIRDDMLAQAREDVLRLALRLADRVVRVSVELTPDSAAQQAAKAVDLVTEPTRLRLLVHPNEVDRIRELLPALERRAQNSTNIAIEPSPDVARGGCVLSHGKGVIDATIEKQIERIVNQLLPVGSSTELTDAEDPPQQDEASDA